MTAMSHHESCGRCHQSTCECADKRPGAGPLARVMLRGGVMKAADTATMRALTTSAAEHIRFDGWEGNGATLIRQPATIDTTGALRPPDRARALAMLDSSGPAFDLEIDAIRTKGSRAYARTCGRWYDCAALLWAGTRRAVAVDGASEAGLLFLSEPKGEPVMLVGATTFSDRDMGYSDLDKLLALRAGGGCPRCGSGEGVCELWCDLEDGGEG